MKKLLLVLLMAPCYAHADKGIAAGILQGLGESLSEMGRREADTEAQERLIRAQEEARLRRQYLLEEQRHKNLMEEEAARRAAAPPPPIQATAQPTTYVNGQPVYKPVEYIAALDKYRPAWRSVAGTPPFVSWVRSQPSAVYQKLRTINPWDAIEVFDQYSMAREKAFFQTK